MDIPRSRFSVLLVTSFLALATLRCSDAATDPPPTESTPAVCAATGATADDWLWVEIDEGQKPVLTIGDGDVPHIAYMLEDMNGWIKYSEINNAGQPTPPTTIVQGYFYGPIDIAVGQGKSVVAYHNHGFEDQVLQVFAVAQGWSGHRMVREGHDGWHSSIRLGPLGLVHTATIDPVGFAGDGIVYALFEDGVWTPELAAAGDISYDWGLSLATTDDGTVYIAYFDGDAGVGKIARRNGPDSWGEMIVEGIPSGYTESGRFPQLEFDAAGNLHLAYLARAGTAGRGAIRYATGTFGNLTVQEVDVIDDIQVDLPGGKLGARNIVDIELDSNGRPVLVYQSRSVTYIARSNGSGFDIEELPASSYVTFCASKCPFPSTARTGST
ncbi:MAG: hypothetical protein O7I93_00995 [Gemmatimonadetes bacterium]|nr:hypothetical protein [Gemmatimonadota bacterium]